ncbi:MULTISPECIES: hypothetical protein [unclassified Meridianimarinicoccus]|uniref:hypothetical protein n=1 Tax=unclassified Meridianimarinicoccus TaxID=2923344 RepID=UPI00186947AB|nr:hypothetical protein [Fluviibacterium sp. MJW13]
MEPGPIIAERWPNLMPELRRRSTIDPGFRELLSDYREAWEALDRWRAIDPESSCRIADYDRLVRELEAEIEKELAKDGIPVRTESAGIRNL